MYQLNIRLLLVYLTVLVISCQAQMQDSSDENHIDFYNQIPNKKILIPRSSSDNRFSIFHKRTRPIFRKNNKHQQFGTNYQKLTSTDQQINNSSEHNSSQPMMKLNKSKASVEFVDIYDGDMNKQNHDNNHYDESNNRTNKTAEPTYAQQTVLAFEHGLKMKQEAKCEKPKPTVVYLNQNKDQIKIYMPRATILHRCGQNTGCCERESDQCVAVEQQQVNLYFFVIKLENEFDEFNDNRLSAGSVRKGRKFATLDQDDNNLLKEYEYNLDYSLNSDNSENSIRPTDLESRALMNRMESENNYLNMLLNEDNMIKNRLTRSINNRKSKELFLDDSSDESTAYRNVRNVAPSKRNLSKEDDEQPSESKYNRINSKKPYSNFLDAKKYSSNRGFNYGRNGAYRNHIRRSLGGQLRPKQTIEMLTFTNHTKCACVTRF